GRIGTDYYFETRKRIIYDQSNENHEGGEFWQQHRTAVETNADVILTVRKDITNDFTFDGKIGANYMNNKYNYMQLSASALTVPNLFTIGNVTGNPGYSMTDREYESNSVFGEVNLAFRNYVFLSFTGRNDWSSTLPKDNWSYFYPSVSLGFIFTDAFGLSGNILSYGKIRANYAQIGAFAGAYQIVPTYSAASPFNGIPQYRYTRELPPLDLKPEQTTAFEVGGEMKFFMNRIGFDLTYFHRLTSNQIMAVDITPSTGFTSMRINAGEIENAGIELILNGTVLQSSTGLNWDVKVNFFKNNNMINELYGDLEAYQIGSSWNSVSMEARPGEPWGNIYGGGYLRDDQGRVVVSDGLPEHDPDPVLLGNTEPDWTGGITNRLSWKGLQLSILIDVRKGGDIFSVTDWFGGYSGVSQETVDGNVREEGVLYDGVNADGSPNTTRIAAEEYFQGWWGLHEECIIDGSFIKLRELTIGYDIPQSIMERIGFVNSANIALIGRNLALLWTHETNTINIDPETTYGTGNSQVGMEQYQLPATRSMGIQLRVNF
ncbi:MAG: TonB-dependent receptor, partial [Bacteroidales bacterium]